MCADARSAYPDLCGEPANEILGWDLNALIDDGPEETLTETQHAQPSLYAVSYALWSEFAAHVAGEPFAAAGHSLGEYTALAAAGAIGYLDGLKLVAERGAAMADAAALVPSGMAALLGADMALAEAVVAKSREDGGNLSLANVNAPSQIVVAGGLEDLEWLEQNARDLGVRRAIRLKVAGAFHSPYMAPAAEALRGAIEPIRFTAPGMDVYANATAEPTIDPGTTLATQLTAPVRFSETLENMAQQGVESFVHIGPGDVTAGLVRRTVEGVDVRVVSTLEEARTAAGELSLE